MEAKRDEIEKAIKQAKKESEGCMQGWHVDVEIDEADVWVTGLMSCGSQSGSSFNGESYIVTSVNSWKPEIDEGELITTEPAIYAEYLAQKDHNDGYESACEFMEKKYPAKLEEWKDEAIEFEVDETDVSEILDYAIEQAQNYYDMRGE